MHSADGWIQACWLRSHVVGMEDRLQYCCILLRPRLATWECSRSGRPGKQRKAGCWHGRHFAQQLVLIALRCTRLRQPRPGCLHRGPVAPYSIMPLFAAAHLALLNAPRTAAWRLQCARDKCPDHCGCTVRCNYLVPAFLPRAYCCSGIDLIGGGGCRLRMHHRYHAAAPALASSNSNCAREATTMSRYAQQPTTHCALSSEKDATPCFPRHGKNHSGHPGRHPLREVPPRPGAQRPPAPPQPHPALTPNRRPLLPLTSPRTP